MAAQKYWRIEVSATAGGFYAQVVDVEFIGAGDVVLSVGGVAAASSEFDSRYVAANAFDGNPTTRWANTEKQFPCWVSYAHPLPVDVHGVRVTWHTVPDFMPVSLAAIAVRHSSDGVSWGAPMSVALVSGALSAGATCMLAPRPLIVVDLPSPTHVPSLAYTGPYGHAVTMPALLHTADLRTPPLGTNTGTVYGTTEVKTDPLDKPVRARVLLLREKDGKVIREMWSDPVTGAYRFDDVDTGGVYTVLTYHPTRDLRAVVADAIVPEVRP